MNPTLLTLIIVMPILGVPLVAATATRSRTLTAWMAAAAMGASLVALLMLAQEIFSGKVLIARLSWLPEWGFDLALRLDGLSFLFAALILGIGLLIALYAAYYLPEKDRSYRRILVTSIGIKRQWLEHLGW
jgi:multicomponent K+:H+ antiporter subunit A